MEEFSYESSFPVPAGELFLWHARPGAFERLAPPWEEVRIVRREGGLHDGDRLLFTVGGGALRLKWEAVHEAYEEGRAFTDRQVSGPFAEWVHEHLFLEDGPDRSVLHDHIRYRLPLGVLGRAVAGTRVRERLQRTFAFRHARTAADLERHARYPSNPLRIAISGASGLVGRNLAAFLGGGGHQVLKLVRKRPASEEETVYWDPSRGELDAAKLEGVDAVVHLAGENISSGRWDKARKEAIRASRVEGTRLLASALAGLRSPPRVMVCASAVGYYGDRGEEVLDESSAPGEDFLASVCREWEEASRLAASDRIRVVNLRIGVVLARRGGALERMLTPFRLGLGGRVGSGSQYMSWISLDDLLGVIQFSLFTEGLSGPVNAVAPGAVTSAAFAQRLAAALHRPALFPLPAAAVRAVFGEMGEALLLSSTRVRPKRLLDAGFSFLHPDLDAALKAELGLSVK